MIYVRTTLSVEGINAVHVAELEEIDAETCRMVRLVDVATGPAEIPNEIVPHPNTYDTFPDIEAEYITAAEFEELWLNEGGLA